MSSNPPARPGTRPAGQPTPVPIIALSALSVGVAVVLFVVWLLDWGPFALVPVSMGLAVLAIGLLWSSRWVGTRTEPSHQDAAREGPAPDRVEGPASATRKADTPAVPDARADSTVGVPARPEPETDARVEVAAAGPHRDDADGADDGVDDGFPIADYDQLWVSQIVPLLAQLDTAELAMVEAGERAGRNRSTIVAAIAAAAEDAPTAPASAGLEEASDRADDVEQVAIAPDVEVTQDVAEDAPSPATADLPCPADASDADPPDDTPPDDEPIDGEPAYGGPGDHGDHGDGERVELSDEGQTSGARVLTFLGRRRSPMTVRPRQ